MAGNNADFLVTVGADIDAYLKGLGTADDVAKKTSKDIVRSLAEAAKASSAMGGSVAKSSNATAYALNNLGRVAQDVPFGFIGIQNNINPLLESFQRLKQETGSTGSALKALASGLMGAGGLGLAISVATSAITLFTMWQQRSKKATDDNKESISAYDKALKDATNSAAQEITKATALYDATQNENLSRKERLSAVKELQKEYPAYFGNLDKEAILAGKAAGAYDNLTNSLINSAIVKAAEVNIQEAVKPLADFLIEQKKLQNQIDKQNAENQKKNPNKVTNFTSNTPGFTMPVISGSTNRSLNQFIDDQTTAAKKAGTDGLQTAKQYSNKLNAVVKDARDAVQSLLKDFGINSLVTPQKQAIDAAKTLLQGYEEQLKKLQDEEQRWIDKGNKSDFFNLTVRERQINELMAKIEMLKNAQDSLNETPVAAIGKAPAITGTDFNPQSAGIINGMKAFAQAKQQQIDFRAAAKRTNIVLAEQAATVASFTNIFGSGLTQAFQTALSGTQSFFSAMGSFLGQLIT